MSTIAGPFSPTTYDIWGASRGAADQIVSQLGSQIRSLQENQTYHAELLLSQNGENTNRIVGAIDEIFPALQSLSSGVNAVETSIKDVGDRLTCELRQVLSSVQSGLELIADQQRANNLNLEKITELLKVPDFQKERLYYIERGFKHYCSAIRDPDFYADALDNFLQAELREKSDYRVLYRIGLIYLYGPEKDSTKALDYFQRAGKYARADAEIDQLSISVLTDRYLGLEVPLQNSDAFASIAYFHASCAAKESGDIDTMVLCARKAMNLNQNDPLMKFNLIRSLLYANGDDVESCLILKCLLEEVPLYALVIAGDPLFISNNNVANIFDELIRENLIRLDTEIKEVKEKIGENEFATIVFNRLVLGIVGDPHFCSYLTIRLKLFPVLRGFVEKFECGLFDRNVSTGGIFMATKKFPVVCRGVLKFYPLEYSDNPKVYISAKIFSLVDGEYADHFNGNDEFFRLVLGFMLKWLPANEGESVQVAAELCSIENKVSRSSIV